MGRVANARETSWDEDIFELCVVHTPVSRRIADMLRSAIRAAGHTIQKIIEEEGWETVGPVESNRT